MKHILFLMMAVGSASTWAQYPPKTPRADQLGNQLEIRHGASNKSFNLQDYMAQSRAREQQFKDYQDWRRNKDAAKYPYTESYQGMGKKQFDYQFQSTDQTQMDTFEAMMGKNRQKAFDTVD